MSRKDIAQEALGCHSGSAVVTTLLDEGFFTVDIEADGLLDDVTKIHCIVLKHSRVEGAEYFTQDPTLTPPTVTLTSHVGLKVSANRSGSIIDGYYRIKKILQDSLVSFHNGCAYDLPLLWKILGAAVGDLSMSPAPMIRSRNTVDTLVLSNMMYPFYKLHGLDAWGKRLKYPKIAHEDWSVLSEDMLKRCLGDVLLSEDLTLHLANQKRAKAFFGLPLYMESLVAEIHTRQVAKGVVYDQENALRFWNELGVEVGRLKEKIIKGTGLRCIINKSGFSTSVKKQKDYKTSGQPIPFSKAMLKDRKSYTAIAMKYFSKVEGESVYSVNLQGDYTPVAFVELNVDSSDELKNYLLTLGWKPTTWNKSNGKKTSPKLTEDSYDSLPDGIGKTIARYNTLKHRRNLILNVKSLNKGALAAVREDGRIPALAMTCGTNTSRYKHKGSICNVPAPRAVFGKEIRSTFTVPLWAMMMGGDLKGIEARGLASYIMRYEGGKELAAIITDGDYHQHNADAWGVDRDKHAKGGLYALMYGCLPPKLAETLGKPKSQGQMLFDAFWAANKPIEFLNADLARAYKIHHSSYIIGLDGRYLYCTEERKLLNTLLQNAGTMVFKCWMIIMDYMISKYGYNFLEQIIAYHDEVQYECGKSFVAMDDTQRGRVVENLSLAALAAGEFLGVNVPTPADFKLGKNWADTH